METMFKVYIDGVSLDSLSEDIYVVDITEASPQIDISTFDKYRYGQFVTDRVRRELSVTIQAEVHAYDPQERQYIADRIQSWCNGHMLQSSTRPGKHLHVVCTRHPQISALKWTENISIVFTAYEVPYWEEDYWTTAERTGTGGVVLNMPGTAETEVEAEAAPVSAAAIAFEVRKGTEIITVNARAEVGERFVMRHENGLLKLAIAAANGEERSVYSGRTASSADEVHVQPGRNDLYVTATTECRWTVRARGRWL